MSQRKDATITTKGKKATILCPKASTLGYCKYKASPGDFITFDVADAQGNPCWRHGRVIGRVDAAGWDGADKTPIKGWLCVMMLSTDLTFAHEMWVNPEWVQYVYSPAGFVEFFTAFFTRDPMDLMRMSEYGSLGANHSNQLPPERKPEP